MSRENVSNIPHSKFVLSHETVTRIENLADTKVTRGMDRILNTALDKLESRIKE